MRGSGARHPDLFPRAANVPLILPSVKWRGQDGMKKKIQKKVSFRQAWKGPLEDLS